MAAEVRDVLSAVTVPVKLKVVNGSKQFEPSTWSAPLIVAPAWPILPANVRGAFPGAVDVAVNCQFPSAAGAWGAVEGADAELPGARPGAPPQPQKRTATKSARMISKAVTEPPLSPDGV